MKSFNSALRGCGNILLTPAATVMHVFGLSFLALGLLSAPVLAQNGLDDHGKPEAGIQDGHGGPSEHVVETGKSGVVDSSHMAAVARAVTQRMIMDYLLAALGGDSQEKIDSIEKGRQQAGDILKALRHGDDNLRMRKITDPELLKKLAIVDDLWGHFDPIIEASANSGEFSGDWVKAVDELSEPLIWAMDDMAATFERLAYGGKTFSALTRTVNVAVNQEALAHRMSRQLLLIAFGLEAERNRIRLTETAAKFTAGLNALTDGDPEMKVIGAPNAALKEQFGVVKLMWDGYLPAIKKAAATGEVSRQTVGETVSAGMRIAEEIEKAVELYHDL